MLKPKTKMGKNKLGLTFSEWMVQAGYEPFASPPALVEAMYLEWEANEDPRAHVGKEALFVSSEN